MEIAIFVFALSLVYFRLYAWIRNDIAITEQAAKRAELAEWRERMAAGLKR